MVNHPTNLQRIGVSQVANRSNLPLTIDLRPTILKRTEQDFIGAMLAELNQGGVQTLTGALNPATPAEVLTLLQPVHRTFYIAVLEVVCDPYQLPALQPRLDPRQIDSAGLVVRRLHPEQSGVRQGWCKQDGVVRGWLDFTPGQETLDPDPILRSPTLSAGHPDIDRLFPSTPTYSESVAPLFIAPPDVCAAAGRTIVYGVIPVTSPEHSDVADASTYDRDFVRNHLVDFLRPGGVRSLSKANQTLVPEDADNLGDRDLQRFILMLRQLMFELDAFGDSVNGKALFQVLNQLSLTYDDQSTQLAGQALKQAATVLVLRTPAQSFKMPREWVAISQTVGDRILQLAQAALNARLATVRPQEGRFDNLRANYQLRAFMRVKRPDGCPPQLVWSAYSNPFAIAPWYANSGLPPVQVALPDVLDDLKNLKPGVAFAVPPKLFDFLQKNDPKTLLNGGGSDGDSGGIAWICSFNIPIITLCAYIVLNIFLQLFNIIFQWLFFIKICIPIPKKLFPKQ